MAVLPGEHMQQQLLSLAETVKDDYGRLDLSSMWRPYARCAHTNMAQKHMTCMCEIDSVETAHVQQQRTYAQASFLLLA